MDHIQERSSFQLTLRYVGRHQLSLCQALQQSLFDIEKTAIMLRMSPSARHKSGGLVSKLVNKLTHTVDEVKSTMEMKDQICTRMESLDLSTISETQANPQVISEQQKDRETRAQNIWRPSRYYVISVVVSASCSLTTGCYLQHYIGLHLLCFFYPLLKDEPHF
jgi:hypothetical protein